MPDKKWLFAFLFFPHCLYLYSQVGLPQTTNFTQRDLNTAGQNWAIAIDSRRTIYCGNSEGMLRYSGSGWELFTLPQNKMVRSLWIDDRDRVYVGAFEEFGFFETDKYGELKYSSLSALLKDYTFHNDEIWSIVPIGGKIYFRSFHSYFQYDGNRVDAVIPPFNIMSLTVQNGKGYAGALHDGLYAFDGENFERILDGRQFNNGEVVGVQPYGNEKLMVFTERDGAFVFDGRHASSWKNDADAWMKEALVNRVISTKDSVYIVGTITDGIAAIGQNGRLLWKVNSSGGLQSETVLGLFCGDDNLIWAALDKGISCIRHGSPLHFITSFGKVIGTVFSACVIHDTIYLGTNQGLFFCHLSNPGYFQRVPGINGQVWELYRSGEQLLCGHNKGTSEISGGQARLVCPVEGGSCFREGTVRGQEALIQSTYTKLIIYKKGKTGKWEYSHPVEGFMNPVRSIEIDIHGNIWAAHFYGGLYAVTLSPDLRQAEQVRHYPAFNREKPITRLFQSRKQIICSDDERFYIVDSFLDTIKPFDFLNEQLPGAAGDYKIIPVANDRYWLIGQTSFRLVKFENNQLQVIRKLPFYLFNVMMSGEENIVPVTESKFLFCLDNGVVIYDSNNFSWRSTATKELRIEKIEAFDKNNQRKPVELSPGNTPGIPSQYNNLLFHIAYPDLPEKNVQYRFRLEGLEHDWSLPESKTTQRYHGLSPGTYTLYVQVLNKQGRKEVLDTAAYSFEILPPFYASGWAKVIYLAMLLLLLFGAYKAVQYIQLADREKRRIRLLREQEEEKFKVIQAEIDELKADLGVKSKELAAQAMESIRRSRILSEMKDELRRQKLKMGQQYPKKYYEKLMSQVEELQPSEDKDNWSVFQSNFDRIHENFFRNLHAACPKLTSSDFKICALLRLNLNTKEMAEILNVSPKSVEVARYRLRKKLGIASDTSLIDYMLSFRSGDNG